MFCFVNLCPFIYVGGRTQSSPNLHGGAEMVTLRPRKEPHPSVNLHGGRGPHGEEAATCSRERDSLRRATRDAIGHIMSKPPPDRQPTAPLTTRTERRASSSCSAGDHKPTSSEGKMAARCVMP